jgi:hypothetical protein
MTSMELRERLIDEIQRIPDTRIAEVFDLIHFFRIGLAAAPAVAETPGSMIEKFAGCWSDMPERDFTALDAELQSRRHAAFGQRRSNETNAD